jgi:hypothetical protein
MTSLDMGKMHAVIENLVFSGSDGIYIYINFHPSNKSFRTQHGHTQTKLRGKANDIYIYITNLAEQHNTVTLKPSSEAKQLIYIAKQVVLFHQICDRIKTEQPINLKFLVKQKKTDRNDDANDVLEDTHFTENEKSRMRKSQVKAKMIVFFNIGG